MHEVSICQSIIEILVEQAALRNKTRITGVTLVIGELSGVMEDAMRFAFEVVSKDTLAEGAKLDIETVPLTARCRACETEFRVDGYAFACAHCGSTGIDIVSGRELMVGEIELE